MKDNSAFQTVNKPSGDNTPSPQLNNTAAAELFVTVYHRVVLEVSADSERYLSPTRGKLTCFQQ